MTGSTQQHYFALAIMAYADGNTPDMYPGEFAKSIGEDIGKVVPTSWGIEQWKIYGGFRSIAAQSSALESFGVEFNKWKQESMLHSDTPVGLTILQQKCAEGLIYQVSPITGEPICGNCATVLTPYLEADIANGRGSCYPCPLCATSPLFKNLAP